MSKKGVKMNFKERLIELLEENQIKYNSVAQQTGIPVTTISNYINRGSTPSGEQLIKLAEFFNVTIDYLVGREDDYVKPQVESTLSYREQKLLRAFNQLDNDEKDKIIEDCEYFANKHTKINQQQRRA